MIKIYNSLQFNFLKKHKFSVYMSKSLNKKEKKFLKAIFLSCSSLNEKKFEISYKLDDLFKLLKFENIKQLEKFINNLISKRVFYEISEESKMLQAGSFGIINSFSIYNNKFYLLLSEELLLSFVEKTLFSYLKIDKFVFMEENFSYNLYLYLIPLFLNQNEVILDLEELKSILDSQNSYERFYDFEKYILKKAIEDITIFSKYKISYSKMKTGKNINNKVTAIKFILNNKIIENYFDVKQAANELLNMIKDKIYNIKEIYELILLYLIKRDYDYVHNNILYVLKSHTKDIEKNFRKALLYDLSNTNKSDKYSLTIEEIKKFDTPFILQMNFWRHLAKLMTRYSDMDKLYYSDLFNKIIKLQDGENFEFKNETFKIFIQYNKNEESIIKIYTSNNYKEK
ncbi:MAG: RepB family plasmid replication initiator protein [Sebaldella sp.]|nr:RepB family plasmid replication initiator protein [Sebaldella sp.]